MPAVLMRTAAGATGPAIKRLVSEPKSSTDCFDAPAEAMASRSSSDVVGSWTPGNPLLYRTSVRNLRYAIKNERQQPRRIGRGRIAGTCVSCHSTHTTHQRYILFPIQLPGNRRTHSGVQSGL